MSAPLNNAAPEPTPTITVYALVEQYGGALGFRTVGTIDDPDGDYDYIEGAADEPEAHLLTELETWLTDQHQPPGPYRLVLTDLAGESCRVDLIHAVPFALVDNSEGEECTCGDGVGPGCALHDCTCERDPDNPCPVHDVDDSAWAYEPAAVCRHCGERVIEIEDNNVPRLVHSNGGYRHCAEGTAETEAER